MIMSWSFLGSGSGPGFPDPLVKNHQILLELALLGTGASVKFLLNESAWWTYRPTWRRNIPLEELQLIMDEELLMTRWNLEEDPRYHQHPTGQEPKKEEEEDKSPLGCIWNSISCYVGYTGTLTASLLALGIYRQLLLVLSTDRRRSSADKWGGLWILALHLVTHILRPEQSLSVMIS